MDKDGQHDDWPAAMRAIIILTESREQHQGAFLGHCLLRGLVSLCESATEVQWTNNLKELYRGVQESANSFTAKHNGYEFTPEEVETWCKFMDQIIYRGHGTIILAMENYQRMWYSCGGPHHPLDFQYDRNIMHTALECGMDQNHEMMLGSEAESYAKKDFFSSVATMEKLEEHGKRRQDAKLNRYEVRALFNVLHIRVSAIPGLSFLDCLSYATMDQTHRKVYICAFNMKDAYFTAQEVVKLCTVGGTVPRPKPLPRSTSSKVDQPTPIPANRKPQDFATDYFEDSMVSEEACIYSFGPTSVSTTGGTSEEEMRATLYNFMSRASKEEPMEVPRENVVALRDLCEMVFTSNVVSQIDPKTDPAHAQVTALIKLFAVVVNQRIILDSEEVSCLSKAFSRFIYFTKRVSQMDSSTAKLQSKAVQPALPPKNEASNVTMTTPLPPSSAPEAIVRLDIADTVEGKAMIANKKEIVELLRSICETKFPKAFAKLLANLDKMRGGLLKACINIIGNGIASMQTEQDQMQKKIYEAEAKMHAIETKAAEHLRSERGAYATLKNKLSKKIEDLEKDLEATKKNLQKAETKITKRAEQHSSYVQKLQSQLNNADVKFQHEIKAHGLTKVDYETTLEELDNLKATTKMMAGEHDAKLLAQEQELAKLRSTRTNPKIEKDNIERAVREAVRAKQTEIDDAKAESRQKQAEVNRLEIELADIQAKLQRKKLELDEKQLELNDVLVQLTDDKPALGKTNEVISPLKSNSVDTREILDKENRPARIFPSFDRQVATVEDELKMERAKSASLEEQVKRMSKVLGDIGRVAMQAREDPVSRSP